MSNMPEEKDWDLLLRRIKDGKRIPFPGAGVCAEKIPVSSQIASEWAKKYDYPMGDSDDLIGEALISRYTGTIAENLPQK